MDEPPPELTDEELDALDPDDDFGGDAAKHPNFHFPTVLLGPATSEEVNTVEDWIRPIACWRVDDTRFEFDSSFVKPGVARELRLLQETREDHPGAKLSLFGHADPVGGYEYNKTLSGRRARAIYGMLIRSPDIWEKLFKPAVGGDNWGEAALETMLATVGRDPAEAKGGMTPETRKALYLQYMDKLCGPKLKLLPDKDFLAAGGGKDLSGDVQGCSEFNAVIRFSKSEDAELQKPKNKAKRDSENAPNRRVVAFFFPAELHVDAKEWPCPASIEPTAKCRKRLWSDHEKRRANQENRREFAKDRNTFECRFYHRLAIKSPCEESAVSSLQKIRVRLRLVYRDPTDATIEHPFPKGYPVEALCQDGTSRKAKVGDDGNVRFVIERSKHAFRVEFPGTDELYFACASPGSSASPKDRLVNKEELDDAIKEGYRLFLVPKLWSVSKSDWPVVESALFNKTTGSFEGFESQDAVIGTRANPVKMVLDPHWQYLRFVYFDRTLKKQMSCLPMMVEGFELAALPVVADTRSNWTTDKNGNQCLPWILRERNLPDQDVLVQIKNEKRTFIETKGGARKSVTVDASGGPGTIAADVVDKPSAERLKYYDLPSLWKSRGYFARLGGAGDAFEKMAGKATSDGQPLVFNLDDIVLVDDKLKALAWNPKNDRIAIFSNLLYQGIAKSLHRPDPSAPYISLAPTTVTDRNYLVDYPDWTRVILMRGSIFDVFDRRTADSDTGVVGARGAVRWADGASIGGPGTGVALGGTAVQPAAATMTQVQLYFSQDHPNRGQIGRSDLAILRCCDVSGDVEVAVNLHYFRYNFDFNPAPIPSRNTTPTTLPNPDPGFVNSGIQNLSTRWNGPDGTFNPGKAAIVPAAATPKLQIAVIWVFQAFPQPLSGTFTAREAHYTIDIFKDVRGFMNAGTGRGAVKDNANGPEAGTNGYFVLAHESGHADSMEDEYVETQNHASYFQPGFEDFIPGSPFEPDGQAMMEADREVRPRYYWHAAEWLRSIYKVQFKVQHDGFDFKLPDHPNGPTKTFVTSSWREKRNTRQAGGFYDIYLFRLGKEKYSATVLDHGPFDGLLRVVLRMKCTFFHNNHDKLRDQTSKMLQTVEEHMNGKFFVTGDFGGETFTRCRLSFSPRFLVTNDSGDADYHKAVGVSATRTYAQIVQGVEDSFGTHYDVFINQTGSSGVLLPGGAKGTTNINVKDFDLEENFPTFFCGMVGVSMIKGDRDKPASYLAMVGDVMNNAAVHLLK